jgi:hypothetical protein
MNTHGYFRLLDVPVSCVRRLRCWGVYSDWVLRRWGRGWALHRWGRLLDVPVSCVRRLRCWGDYSDWVLRR